MELELDRAASRLKKEQASRVQKEKARRVKERAAQDEAARNSAEMEAKATEKRMERDAREVAAEEAEAERARQVLETTGGIEFSEVRPTGVTLPQSSSSSLFLSSLELNDTQVYEP